MIIFEGNYVLKQILETIYPYANQILISEGPVSYFQQKGLTTSTDGTNEILNNFPDPDNKITIIHSQYKEKDDQCKSHMKYLKGNNNYIWNLDSDEVFKPEDIEKLIGILEKEKYTSVGFKSYSFYGGFDRYITGFEENAEFLRIHKIYPGSRWKSHRPPDVVHLLEYENLPKKHLDFNILWEKYGIRMYHYSYVFPDQVYNKIDYYTNAVSNCIQNYFNEIYLAWVNSDDLKKKIIEDKFQGVHEWLPNLRGDAYTKEFTNKHPLIIQRDMMKLKEKFDNQLKKYMNI